MIHEEAELFTGTFGMGITLKGKGDERIRVLHLKTDSDFVDFMALMQRMWMKRQQAKVSQLFITARESGEEGLQERLHDLWREFYEASFAPENRGNRNSEAFFHTELQPGEEP